MKVHPHDRFVRRFVAISLLWLSARAIAQEPESLPKPLGIEIHGFVSQGFFFTTENQYLSRSSERGTFEFSEAGVNFTKSLTDQLQVGLQVFARNVGTIGNFDAKLDWFYLDYHWRDWLGLRAGRIKIPFGLYNEINDVDSGRVPVLLPQSIYPIGNRDFLLAQTGGETYGYVDLTSAGALEYRAYGGTIFLDISGANNPTVEIESLHVPYLVGGRLLWETPWSGLRMGGSAQYLRLDTDLLYDSSLWAPLVASGDLPPTFTGLVHGEVPAFLWVGSVEHSMGDLLLAAEYSRWHVRLDSGEPLLLPESKSVSERAYAMASYRMARWFQPGLYYSIFYPDTKNRSGREAYQHDIAGTLRFDINDYWLVKLEGHYYIGTAGLNPALNDGTPLTALSSPWGSFFLKTTVHF